jgi:catechol 2,3-dioxygenase-like lactoylglutathione lyase family enzyme
MERPRLVGINHVALEVGDLEEAVRFYGRLSQPGRGLSFRDPWGNLVELVDYRAIQFTKVPPVLEGMGLRGLGKTDAALEELRAKGLGGLEKTDEALEELRAKGLGGGAG